MANNTEKELPALWAKKVCGNRLHPRQRIKHGTVGWAEFKGQVGRTQFYFNEYLPKETPWEDRWMSLVDLRKTPKPCYVDENRPRIGFWQKRLADLGRIRLIWPGQVQEPEEVEKTDGKTEGQGRHPDHKTGRPIGSEVYT